MKLGQLKSTIRDRKGNPAVTHTFPNGLSVILVVQKQSILDALDRAFDHKGVETGLTLLDDDGLLVKEAVPTKPVPSLADLGL